MSLENTLREMLSEQNRPGPGIGPFGGEPVLKPKETIDLSTGKPYVRPPKKPSSTSIPKPAPVVNPPVVNPKPKAEKDNIKSHNPKGLKEFYKARLEGALLGETHEMSALEGARREGRLDRIAKGIHAAILAAGVAAGGYRVGNLATDSIMRSSRDVATHNAQVAAGEVVPPKGVSIKAVMDTAKPSPAYGVFQRGAIAAREAAREAARAKGKKGK
jgi:hypothetical protein